MQTNFNANPYRNLTAVCNHLMQLILKCDEDNRNLPFIVKEWRECENTKRDWRGIPRLSTHKLAEVIAAKRANAKHIEPSDAPFVEIEPPTVTAPPPPSPP